MADEAVVRVVVVDGGSSGRPAASTQSSAAGLTSSAGTLPGSPDRLYRELQRSSTDITAGFKKHTEPVLSKLDTIADLLSRDYEFSDKEFKEVQSQTSILRLIGAALGSDSGAVARELAKGAGLQSSDTQMITVLNKINESIKSFDNALNPEVKKFGSNISKGIAVGAIGGLGASLYDSAEFGPKSETHGVGTMITNINESISKVLSNPASVKPFVMKLYESIAESLSSMDTQSLEILGGVGMVAAGAAIGGIISYFSKGEEPKEKSTNELLQEIVQNTEGMAESADRALTFASMIEQNTSAINNVSTFAGMIEQNSGSILNLLNTTMGGIELEGGIDAMHEYDTMQARSSHGPPVELDPGTGYNMTDEMVNDLVGPPEVPADYAPARHGGPDWTGDRSTVPPALDEVSVTAANIDALPNTELHSDPNKTGLYTPSKWDTWIQQYIPGHYLNDPQKAFLESSGWSGYKPGMKQLSGKKFTEFIDWLKASGGDPPVGLFARGGAIGTDTVPAMLSPGEVVVPKEMVDGGAVDHLRGQLPGFAEGGKVGRTWAGFGKDLVGGTIGAAFAARSQAVNFATTTSADTGGSIGQFGAGISAVGEKLSTALPMVGGFVAGLGKATEAFGSLISAVNEVADRYGEYSPQIAQAQAMAEIKQTMGDFRRAQEIGTEMARFVTAQADMQQKFEDIKIKLLMQMVPVLTRILEFLESEMFSGDGIENALKLLVSPMNVIAENASVLGKVEQERSLPVDPSTMLLSENFNDAGRWVPQR